ncbi:hypothetical protein ABFX02_14G150600 [Erythranthe guttata]
MSNKFSLGLVFLLLCFSLHACNARNLGVAHNKRKYLSGEETKTKKTLEEKNFINGEYDEPRKYFHAKSDQIKESSATKKWKIPHKKRPGRQEPGFNQDYSPPKTHPPVHN